MLAGVGGHYRGRDRGVVAVDVAGDEIRYPGQLFARHFQRAREAGMRAIVHAGESTSAAQVKQAIIELQAERLGHAVRAIDDPDVVELIHTWYGVSFSYIAPVVAIVVANGGYPAGVRLAQGGILVTGLVNIVAGLIVRQVGKSVKSLAAGQ